MAPLLQKLIKDTQEMRVAVFSELGLLMNMANDMLAAAVQQEREQIDQKLSGSGCGCERRLRRPVHAAVSRSSHWQGVDVPG
jgi:aerobic-type carbon monoxide dehydrogenase small subunit (CoxS/CutS family)